MLESTEIQHSGQFYKQVENLIESVDVLIESVDVKFMITLGSDQINLTVDTSKCMSLSDLVKKINDSINESNHSALISASLYENQIVFSTNYIFL